MREELRNGAHQIKVMAGGGVASPSDPLEGTQYSIEEMTAIVEEAHAARTYVMAHAYTPESISRAIRCGVRTIEHGNLLDAATADADGRARAPSWCPRWRPTTRCTATARSSAGATT